MQVPTKSTEPAVEDWAAVDVATLLQHLDVPLPDRVAVVAVDGRSGAGKSTLARRLARAVPGAAVVATDDIGWHFSRFDWATELARHVIEPVRCGHAVRHRPPGWIAQDRPGAVTVEAGRSLLVIEGVGSAQRRLADAVDAAIWVQSDAHVARTLGIERDVASGVNGDRGASAAFWDEWAAAEEPFLEREAPWTRANAVVAGVPMTAGLHWRAPADAIGWRDRMEVILPPASDRPR